MTALRMLRVLMVTTSFPVSRNSASGVFVKRLADALSNHVELTVLTPDARKEVSSTVSYKVRYFRYAPSRWQKLAHEPGGVPVILKSNPLLLMLLPAFALLLFLSVLRYGRQVDVIHANWSLTGLIAGTAAMFIRKPVVTTLRGADASSLHHSRISRTVMGLVVRTSRRIVTVSEAIADDIRSLWPKWKERVEFIPNGVDDELLSLKHCRHKEVLTLLTIGSLIPRKDIALLLHAFARMQFPGRLRIVGDGVERTALESLSAQLSVTDSVVFTGALPPEAIRNELSSADIFVLSSRSEGRPNVLLEAMAAGCAIVSSALPGVLELIKDEEQGLLFEPGDIDALARNLKRLAESQELRSQLGSQARARIIQSGLTWFHTAKCYVRLYQGIRGSA